LSHLKNGQLKISAVSNIENARPFFEKIFNNTQFRWARVVRMSDDKFQRVRGDRRCQFSSKLTLILKVIQWLLNNVNPELFEIANSLNRIGMALKLCERLPNNHQTPTNLFEVLQEVDTLEQTMLLITRTLVKSWTSPAKQTLGPLPDSGLHNSEVCNSPQNIAQTRLSNKFYYYMKDIFKDYSQDRRRAKCNGGSHFYNQ
jgi:hypothetical protein